MLWLVLSVLASVVVSEAKISSDPLIDDARIMDHSRRAFQGFNLEGIHQNMLVSYSI